MILLIMGLESYLGLELSDLISSADHAIEPYDPHDLILNICILESEPSVKIMNRSLACVQSLILIPCKENSTIILLTHCAFFLRKFEPLLQLTLPANLVVSAVTDCKVINEISADHTTGIRMLANVFGRFH